MDQYKILFVDDEINILKSLKRGLRLHCPDWHVEFCSSATDALLLLEDFKPSVVVSDKRMPGMDGITFLRTLSKKAPEIIRVLLTGDNATEVALEAASVAHMVIAKPFQTEVLIQLLHRALSLQKIPVSLAIRKQLGAIERIPVLPKAYQKLVDYLKVDDVDLKEIARIVSLEPSILAKLIQLANSAFLGFANPVSSAHAMVTRLGVDLIKNMVLCFGVFEQCDSVDELVCDQLFTEAMDIALLSKKFSSTCDISRKEIDDSFMLGLLHNIGMLMSNMSVIQIGADDNNIKPKEEDVVGAYLLALWEFDTDFISAVLFQNIPAEADSITALSCRLHVAKVVYNTRKLGANALDEDSELDRPLLQSQELLDNTILWINDYVS